MSSYIAPKVSELTGADLAKMTRAVGLPGLPYPMADIGKKGNQLEYTVGAIQSGTDPLRIYSPHLSIEQVNRELYVNMPTPSMMTILRDLIEITKPESKSHLMTIFGDPSSGKSFMFKQVGKLVHPEGALMVDCGGMNVRELFWRTIIDYGQGVKEQLNDRAAKGTINPKTIEALRAEFPAAVVEKNGAVAIDWSAIGEPKENEAREAAVNRAQALLSHIYGVYEGLNVQSNAFGIKTVPGIIIESFRSGRPIVLDEFTKCKIGSDDAMQTFLEFVRGDKSEWVSLNPMATTAADEEKMVTLTSDDTRANWFIGISGNEAKDGHTTHELSESMMSRLNPRYVGQMTEMDWQHRISQMLVGFPLSTFQSLFEDAAKSNPAGFAKLMEGLSTLGLTAAELKMRPAHHAYFLQNFPETVAAVKSLANVYYTRQAMTDTESPLFKTKKWDNCADEIQLGGGAAKLRVTSRRFMDDLDTALRQRAPVAAKGALSLEFDLSKVFNTFDAAALASATPAWYGLGSALSNVLIEGIVNDTLTMPNTRSALITVCEENGIRKADLKEAAASKEQKNLATLLHYDPLKDKGLGDTGQLKAVAGVLIAAIKGMYPDVRIGADQLPLENIGQALQQVQQEIEASRMGIIVPNSDLDELVGRPVAAAYSIPVYMEDDIPQILSGEGQLVQLSSALAALAMPGHQQQNMSRMWLLDLEDRVELGADPRPETIEASKILAGRSTLGLDLCAVKVANAANNESYLLLLRDTKRNAALVMGDETLSPELKSALGNNNVSYIQLGETGNMALIDGFIQETFVNRGLTDSQASVQVINLMTALWALYGIGGGHVDTGGTFSNLLRQLSASNSPSVYSQVMAPKP